MIETQDVTIENRRMRLVISSDGLAKSLVYKPTQEECLVLGKMTPLSTITEPRPYQNEIKLAYLNKKTTFKSNAVRRQGDQLIIGYELIPWEVTVGIKITDDYIAFTMESFTLTKSYGIPLTEPPVSEMMFLQLPVREREHWGDWLNVIWDDEVAINLLAADPYANVDSEEAGDGCRILQAGSSKAVRLIDTTAVLITCARDELLDTIAQVETDYGLPRGVDSRRHALYNASHYKTRNVNLGNVDEHIRCAKAGGFRLMCIYYPAFLENRRYLLIGNYDVFRKEYPNGKADLKAMLEKIKAAGITPGCHFLPSHIGRESRYVTPIPDHRLNLVRIFTLARPLRMTDTTIYVEQNPIHSPMDNGRRVLKIGTELISYAGFTTQSPYTFHGCERASDATTASAQPVGLLFGVLDVSEYGAMSVYIDQNSSLQDEVADRIADLWDAGFAFFYFDGSEGVQPPFWHHVANAQYRVFSKLKPEPVFTEGAAKTHFSWHMLTGANAFDVFSPEKLREETIRHPLKQAPRMRDSFSRLNFGWQGYWLPSETTIGTQPDQLEFVTSKAAAWDCPVCIETEPDVIARHPRTADNFDVLKRWEDVRATQWLTADQKQMLRNPQQEFILLLDEQQNFELTPYKRLEQVAGGSREVLAFTFKRGEDVYVVYWHISADKRLEIPLRPEAFVLMERLGTAIETAAGGQVNTSLVPIGKRRYLKVSESESDELLTALKHSRLKE